MTVKKKITTLFMALSLAWTLSAQQHNSQMGSSAQSKLLSSTTEGNYTVNRYLVQERGGDNDEFSVRYKVNLSRLISSYDDNEEEIKKLHSFIKELQVDTLKSITSVNVIGCASPDGVVATNEKLALSRAVDFRQYLNRNFDMSNYKGSTQGNALSWSDTYDAVSTSSMPKKSEVLELVKSGSAASVIESKLKGMPQSWSYMKEYILPPMRCVELCVKYNSWKVVETRTMVKSCAPKPTKIVENSYLILIVDEPEGVVINSSQAAVDYEFERFKETYKENEHRQKFKERERFGDRETRKRTYIRRK